MHELLLFALVPKSNHDHVLAVLAGVTAMQPLPLLEQRLIFKPTRKPGTTSQATGSRVNQSLRSGASGAGGGVTPGGSSELFYLQLVGDLTSKRNANGPTNDGFAAPESTQAEQKGETDVQMQKPTSNGEIDKDSSAVKEVDTKRASWTVEFRDLPDVQGTRSATSRLMYNIPITQGTPRAFVEALGYVQSSSYFVAGDSFTWKSVSIRLFRTLPSNPASISATPDLKSISPLDRSGGYVLQASLRVQDGSKPELMKRGFDELSDFKDLLKGIVDLSAGDRLSMDPRVR